MQNDHPQSYLISILYDPISEEEINYDNFLNPVEKIVELN
jgi:hypothetical protein